MVFLAYNTWVYQMFLADWDAHHAYSHRPCSQRSQGHEQTNKPRNGAASSSASSIRYNELFEHTRRCCMRVQRVFALNDSTRTALYLGCGGSSATNQDGAVPRVQWVFGFESRRCCTWGAVGLRDSTRTTLCLGCSGSSATIKTVLYLGCSGSSALDDSTRTALYLGYRESSAANQI